MLRRRLHGNRRLTGDWLRGRLGSARLWSFLRERRRNRSTLLLLLIDHMGLLMLNLRRALWMVLWWSIVAWVLRTRGTRVLHRLRRSLHWRCLHMLQDRLRMGSHTRGVLRVVDGGIWGVGEAIGRWRAELLSWVV